MRRKRLRHPGHWLPRHVVDHRFETVQATGERIARRDRHRQIRDAYFREIHNGVTQPFVNTNHPLLRDYRRRHRSAFRRSPRVAWYLRAIRAVRDGSANDMNYARTSALEFLPEELQDHIQSFMMNDIERDLEHARAIHSDRTGYYD